MMFTKEQLAAEAVAVLRRDGKTQLADAVHDVLVAAIDQRGALSQIVELAGDADGDEYAPTALQEIDRIAKAAQR